jgi:hypothetical protein
MRTQINANERDDGGGGGLPHPQKYHKLNDSPAAAYAKRQPAYGMLARSAFKPAGGAGGLRV